MGSEWFTDGVAVATRGRIRFDFIFEGIHIARRSGVRPRSRGATLDARLGAIGCVRR
jgi:hypothetical protein